MKRFEILQRYTQMAYGIAYFEVEAENEEEAREMVENGDVYSYNRDTTDWDDYESHEITECKMVEDYDPEPEEDEDDPPIVRRLMVERDILDEDDSRRAIINDYIEKLR